MRSTSGRNLARRSTDMSDYYGPSIDRIKEIREEKECGVYEAKRIAKGERLLWLLRHYGEDQETIHNVLREVIKDVYGAEEQP